jgi:hypothetical protein
MLATGYIHDLIDNKLNLKQFVCSCARAFGPLVHMRDDSSAEIKEAKVSEYYVESLKESTEKLEKLGKMTKKEKIAYGEERRNWYLDFYRKEMERENAQLKIIEEMKISVRAWEPPSEDHKPLKAFMLQQLGDAVSYSEYEKDIEKASKKSPMDYYNEELKECKRSIERAKEEIVKETKNVEFQNKWIKTLLSSI